MSLFDRIFRRVKPPESVREPPPKRPFRYEPPDVLRERIEAYFDKAEVIEPFNPNKPNTIRLEGELALSLKERNPFPHSHFEGTALDNAFNHWRESTREEWIEICSEIRDRKRKELNDRMLSEREEQRKRERDAREAQRKQERDEREAKRQLEKELAELKRQEEQELRDPTPVIQDDDVDADIPYNLRPMHVCIPGGTQRGKTNLMRQLVLRDIENGLGVAVLDPKGTLIRGILNELDEAHRERAIYLDLDTPVPVDFMGHNPDERESLVSDLKYIVLKGDESLKRAGPILTDLIWSLLSCTNTTFLDIHEFFADRNRRKAILDELKVKNPKLWNRWTQNFPTPTQSDPLVARMNDFVRNPSLAAIFDDPNPNLNISKIMEDGNILLVNLGPIRESKKIFGSLLVSKFQQAAFRRANLPKSKIKPFYLYVDEFEYFQTGSFAEIFSVAGGLGLNLTIGHQFSDQLDPAILSAVTGNAGSYIIFQVGQKDLHLYPHVIQPYGVNHLAALAPFQACFKVGPNPPIWKRITPPPTEDEKKVDRRITYLKEQTLEKYGAHSAQISTIRPVDSTPCDTPPVRFNEKDDEIQPTSEPLPPNPYKAKGP